MGLLSHRRNLIVSAPTNAGKSLVGTLALLDAVRQGKRAVLVEPLRALAQEKFEELDGLAPKLGRVLGKDFKVRIATGDYRLEQDHRGIKGRYKGMRGFHNFASAQRFCDAYDGLRDYLRPRSRTYEILPLPEQRNLYLKRTQALVASVGGV